MISKNLLLTKDPFQTVGPQKTEWCHAIIDLVLVCADYKPPRHQHRHSEKIVSDDQNPTDWDLIGEVSNNLKLNTHQLSL